MQETDKYTYPILIKYTLIGILLILFCVYWYVDIRQYVSVSKHLLKTSGLASALGSLILTYILYRKRKFSISLKICAQSLLCFTFLIFIVLYLFLSYAAFLSSGVTTIINSDYTKAVGGRKSCPGIIVTDDVEGNVKVCSHLVLGKIRESGEAIVETKTNTFGIEVLSAVIVTPPNDNKVPFSIESDL
ncbi:hypothetical protein J6836_03230 [Providencia sp. R33]|uniref:hypothetical protein n=1 Tax=Providencia TaxID=586 RepID=UPI001C5BB164|nr:MULTISPECIES: hypothetical protein [Providencia]QXX83429.1 hypothetical protein J6836_03230 [Providencia sp. R33]